MTTAVITLTTALLIALALLAYMGCVTREDGRTIADLKARNLVQLLELRKHRQTFRDIERAVAIAHQTIADYDADPLGWDATEATVRQFRADLETWGERS